MQPCNFAERFQVEAQVGAVWDMGFGDVAGA